jgi:DNA-binding MurR/RpiR family transcriptional regulator
MENDVGILLRIHAAYNQLTKAEKKVASYVIEHTEDVLYMSITDLADACDVGDTSVYRFCRKMKLDGYQEFKMQLSLSLAAQKKIVSGQETVDTDDLADCVLKLDIKALQDTYLLLDWKAVEHVVSLIEAAPKVYFFGIGDSLVMAEEARNRFMRVTGKVFCIADPHLQAMAASLLGEDDLVFIISYSGATKDTIHVARQAKNVGAKIVGITHFMKSPLTTLTDEVLLCGAKESPLDGGSMAVKMGQLFLIDLLYQQYYKRNHVTAQENKQKTAKSVVEKLY